MNEKEKAAKYDEIQSAGTHKRGEKGECLCYTCDPVTSDAQKVEDLLNHSFCLDMELREANAQVDRLARALANIEHSIWDPCFVCHGEPDFDDDLQVYTEDYHHENCERVWAIEHVERSGVNGTQDITEHAAGLEGET